ncbi:MAG TPA: hypothetical protein VEP90_00560 [Methylomirabilota bacterium]|nr:hypothetical protein [Methylomirabilota bacterium]
MLYDPSKEHDPVRDNLLHLADFIESHGWCQRSEWKFGLFGYRYCLLGSMHQVLGNPSFMEDAKAFRDVERRLWHVLNNSGEWLYSWNDVKGRTKKQVVELVRKAAYLSPVTQEVRP